MLKLGTVVIAAIMMSGTLRANNVSLKLQGDAKQGYSVGIYHKAERVSTSESAGEFTLIVENDDRSIKREIENWKATSAKQENGVITLYGTTSDKRLETDIHLEVIYRVVSNNVVEKSINMRQTNIPMLYYTLTTDLTADRTPKQYWSFDDADNKGGIAHETYPAAGFYTQGGLGVGLLSDAGYNNLWTRNIRRRRNDERGGFRAIRQICDADMVRIVDSQQKKNGDQYVRFTLGNMSDFNRPNEIKNVAIPEVKQWKQLAQAKVDSEAGIYKITGVAGDEGMDGMRLPLSIKDGFYTVKFKYRSNHPLAMRVYKDDTRNVQGFYYQDGIQASPTEWRTIEESVFIANTEDGLTHIMIGNSALNRGDKFKTEIKELQITESVAHSTPYHCLMQGTIQTKKFFIFAAPMEPTLHDFRLASQVYFADGVGFKGSDAEKCLYADAKMLMWITSADNFNILSVPNINYAPDMYNRDSFWSAVGLHNQQISESIFNSWASTQTPEGGIGTIITPSAGSKEIKDNDATLEFLWFALINNREFSTPIPTATIEKTYNAMINMIDPDGDGICKSRFVLGQNDVLEYPEGSSDMSINQGMFAVTLKVAKELGLPVTDAYIEKACSEYRKFYDPVRGYLLDNRDYPYVLTFGSLLPEFVSLWLFDEPILTDEIVINTLNKIHYNAEIGYSPIICHVDDLYFTRENNPTNSLYWENGIYYNAGSWMREEVCGYVAGIKHGWKQGTERIIRRLNAEITLNPDEPFSHEYLPFDTTVPDCWKASTRVFSWNVFALKAMEVAGLRTPDQDPDYRK